MPNPLDPVELNIEGVQQLVGSRLNKNAGDGSSGEGVEGDYQDVLSLKMSDSELIGLAQKWEEDYRGYEGKIKLRQKRNETYYLGAQSQGQGDGRGIPVESNLLFEAEETFIPAALAKNPEPVVWADNTEEGKQQANIVKTMLQYHADTLVLRRKLGLMVRHWSIYFIGAIKHGWDNKVSDITSDVINPQNFIFDPDASIDVYGNYEGRYLGERKPCTAEQLIELFPKYKEYITIMVNGMLGTKVSYTEWWTNEYCFYTFKDVVLDKHKNEFWNYDRTEKETDEFGIEEETEIPGKNHFARPKMPYTFLSVFSLGNHPHDITNLIEQNIPNQNIINKRITQIDTNLDRNNNSIALSGLSFTAETAKQAAIAMQQGNPVLVPDGRVSEAINRFPAPNIPQDAFEQLDDMSTRLRSIFGTEGLSSAGQSSEKTVRGKLLNQQYDNTRIGGGIGDALEQVADNIFNWWVQLYYVFYDEEHEAAILGRGRAVEYVTLRAQDMSRKIVVSVSPNSMKPKDEITEQNIAIDRWNNKSIDPINFMKALNTADPMEEAKALVMWITNPQQYAMTYFPETQPVAPPETGTGVEQDIPPEINGTLSENPASAQLSQVPIGMAGVPNI